MSPLRTRFRQTARRRRAPDRRLFSGMACSIFAICIACPSLAKAETLTRNIHGGIGTIDMPSARMAEDGEFSLGASFFQNSQHYFVGFQAFPWLETSFRYSGLSHFDPSFSVFYDRAFAAKARLWDESGPFPAVAVGINDLVGTGVYGGEYVAASKHLGPLDATVGIGWGRLSTANNFRNPISLLSRSFENRPIFRAGTGGTFDTAGFFRGPKAGFFGSLVWHTPIENLSLVAEFSSDKYVLETASGNFSPRNQLNLGVSYEPFTGTTFGLDWLYGQSIGGSVSFHFDPRHDSLAARLSPPIPPVQARTADQQMHALAVLRGDSAGAPDIQTASLFVDSVWHSTADTRDVAIDGSNLIVTVAAPQRIRCQDLARQFDQRPSGIKTLELRSPSHQAMGNCAFADRQVPSKANSASLRPPSPLSSGLITIDASQVTTVTPAPNSADLRKAIAEQRIFVDALAVTPSEVTVYYTNSVYYSETSAIDRLIRVLLEKAPPTVEKFRLIAVVNSVPQKEFDILRASAERSFDQTGDFQLFRDAAEQDAAPMQNPVLEAQRHYPTFSWTVFPQFRQELFDPSNPIAVQLLFAAQTQIELLPGLTFVGEGEFDIYDNFNTARPPGSVLPHVRTDWSQFFTKGKNGLGQADLSYRFRLAPDVFATVKAGYLESMYAGVGGEVLWRPVGQRWALGADLYGVQKRGFDRLFDLQPYTVMTGHVSIYYESPWYGLNFQIRAGQYLAGDRGLTFQVSRRFASGIELGVFATKTNVSAAQFGEGSFDKGFFFRIPLGQIMPIETQTELAQIIRPVQRDGGQPLIGDATLYRETERASEGELRRIDRNF